MFPCSLLPRAPEQKIPVRLTHTASLRVSIYSHSLHRFSHSIDSAPGQRPLSPAAASLGALPLTSLCTCSQNALVHHQPWCIWRRRRRRVPSGPGVVSALAAQWARAAPGTQNPSGIRSLALLVAGRREGRFWGTVSDGTLLGFTSFSVWIFLFFLKYVCLLFQRGEGRGR